MNEEFSNLAKLLLGNVPTKTTKYNVVKKDENLKIELVLPGFNKEDISLEADGSKLIIKAKSSTEDEDRDELYVWKDFYKQDFEQTLILPKDFTYDNIVAVYESGILKIRLQSTPKASNKITIN